MFTLPWYPKLQYVVECGLGRASVTNDNRKLGHEMQAYTDIHVHEIFICTLIYLFIYCMYICADIHTETEKDR